MVNCSCNCVCHSLFLSLFLFLSSPSPLLLPPFPPPSPLLLLSFSLSPLLRSRCMPVVGSKHKKKVERERARENSKNIINNFFLTHQPQIAIFIQDKKNEER